MVYSGESVPFYQQDVKPSFSQYLCGGTSGRASADNNYIVHGTHPVFLKFALIITQFHGRYNVRQGFLFNEDEL